MCKMFPWWCNPAIWQCGKTGWGLTCQVWGLCVQSHSCEGTLKPGRSQQSTSGSCPQAEDQCSSTGWHNHHLQGQRSACVVWIGFIQRQQGETRWVHTSKPTLPSTYSMTMQRCLLVSKEQNMETTKGFSAKVRMSRSTNTCWIWFLSIKFCRLIFFMAKRWRVSLWRTRNTALEGRNKGVTEEMGRGKEKKWGQERQRGDRRG